MYIVLWDVFRYVVYRAGLPIFCYNEHKERSNRMVTYKLHRSLQAVVGAGQCSPCAFTFDLLCFCSNQTMPS